jgi:hypothetical protein
MCERGGREAVERKKRPPMPRCDPATARGVMHRRGKKFAYKVHKEAVIKRKTRWTWPETEAIAQSQIIVSKRKLRSGSYYPPNVVELRPTAAGLQQVDGDVGQGTEVRWIPQGPRRSRALACGFFLRLVGKAWAVVDRRRRGEETSLRNLFAVPVGDCWVAVS